MGADDMNVAVGSAGRDAADAAQQADHGFRPFIGNGPVQTVNLAVEVNVLALKLGHAHVNLAGGRVQTPVQTAGDTIDRLTFHAHAQGRPTVDSAVDPYRPKPTSP